MNLEEYYSEMSLDELNTIVSEMQEENLNIEFKTAVHPFENNETREIDKKNYSKALSGFANSSGGLLIWGIEASRNKEGIDCARSLRPIEQLNQFLNKLNRLEGQATTPRISGVKHKKIEIEDNKGFIVTLVPKSYEGPHMANFADKYYYKRNGDSFYRAEHYDIVDMFSRKMLPNLEITVKDFHFGPSLKEYKKLVCTVTLVNSGYGIAKYPYLALRMNLPFHIDQFGINGNGATGLKKVVGRKEYLANYIGGADIVVYPKSELDIDNIACQYSNGAEPPDLSIEYLVAAEGIGLKKLTLKIRTTEFLR